MAEEIKKEETAEPAQPEQETTKKEEKSEKEAPKKEKKSKKESETEKESESAKETEAVKETDAEAENSAESSTSSLQTETTAPEPVPQTEAPQPETVQTEPPAPVYKTLNSACYMRSYPDYGDNIIGQYEAGTTVEFLGVVEGWYKVSVGGQTGYMGPKFFD